MNRTDLIEFCANLYGKGLELMKKKNHDYAGQEGNDPFANFQRVELMGICSTEQGFLTRMTDKMSRLATYAKAGKFEVQDEGVEDTLIDVINYAALLAAYIYDKQQKTLPI